MSFHSPREFARPAQAKQWLLFGLVTALLVSTLPLTAQAVSQAEVVINADGGDFGEPGLRIHYGNGQLQVYRNGAGQLFADGSTPGSTPNTSIYNAIALNLEGVAYTPTAHLVTGTSYPTTTQSGGSASGSGTISGTLDTGAGSDVAITIDYTFPEDFFTVTLVVNRGATTAPIKLYHFVDSFLSGGDDGPGFFSADPARVGVAKPGTVEAFRYGSGPAWSGYFSGYFALAWPQVRDGDDFDNTINADPSTDNGFGIMWNLGTAAGTHTVSYDMVVITDAPLVPDSMEAPTAVGGDTSATVSLIPPAGNGSPITGYTVTAFPGGATCTVASATPCVVTGLTNGTAYTFTATATNGNGTSNPSVASNSVTPSGLPATMVAPAAITGDTLATVTVTPPSANGSVITGYTVTASPNGATCAIVPAAVSCAVTGLTNGTAYTFTATATNANGTNTASPASNSVTPSGLPATTVAPTAVAGNTTATVTITPPSSNGSVITGYNVTAAPGGATCAIVPAAVSCAVAALTNGTSYTFTARATNANGTSPASPASNSVTPTAPAPGPTPTPIFDESGSVFTDIPAGEMAVAASWLAAHGITIGCEGGAHPRFCPNDLAARAEVATLLTRALGLSATDVDAFRDDNGHLLEEGLNRAAAADIFLGCSHDRDVCPDDTITRGELAAVLVRALGLVATNPAAFSDVDQHWAQSFIRTIGGLGVSVGCESGGDQFCPEDFGTRGEIALFLYRALTLE